MAKVSYTTLKARADAQSVELTPEEEQQRLSQLVADYEQTKAAKAAREETAAHFERGQIHRMKCVDPHAGKLATWVSLGWVDQTPSMCDADQKCCYDGAEAIGFKGGYDSIPEDLVLPWNGKTARQHAEEVLAQHKALRHATAGPAHVRTPEQARAARAERPMPDTFIENPRL